MRGHRGADLLLGRRLQRRRLRRRRGSADGGGDDRAGDGMPASDGTGGGQTWTRPTAASRRTSRPRCPPRRRCWSDARGSSCDPSCPGSCTTHDDGVGQSYYDCNPLYSSSNPWTETAAIEACAALTGDSAKCTGFKCSGTLSICSSGDSRVRLLGVLRLRVRPRQRFGQLRLRDGRDPTGLSSRHSRRIERTYMVPRSLGVTARPRRGARAIMRAVSLAPPRPSPIAAGYRLDRYELICPIAEGGHGERVDRAADRQARLSKARRRQDHPAEVRGGAEVPAHVHRRGAHRVAHRARQRHADPRRRRAARRHVPRHGVRRRRRPLEDQPRARRRRTRGSRSASCCASWRTCAAGFTPRTSSGTTTGAPLGVVHRDVSPQNVLVTTRGVAKLIDFGIAKARDRLAGDTHGDTLKGKVQYMAPEQALGLPVDRRADVWAVGAVLYHLIAGRPPFEADNEIQTLFMITSGRPPPPLPSDVPAPVRDVVKRALAHSAEARYATAAELQQALEDAIVECEARGHHLRGRGLPRGDRRRPGGEAEGGDRARPQGRRGAREGRRRSCARTPRPPARPDTDPRDGHGA